MRRYWMSFDTKGAARLALIGLAVASLAACSSRPKPTGPVEPTPPAQPQAPQQPYTPPAPVPDPTPQGPLPGTIQDFVVNVGDRVYFDTDEYSVRADAQPVLAGQAQWLNRYQSVRVRIEGNADERGTREYNLALGARRANAVREFLIGQGVAASRIETISFGKERPLDPGTDENAWAKNRNARTAITDGAR
ncbi:peptidoglycan-associated lipoprotein Pal [Caulobacter sp. D4A]|uniref:peptidoglycan-associated lipoprotein Pal n=1 Tax=unclassified Caulobacter TaxID=2648921 RepID=UPI000D7263FE|nr:MULTISPECIES: peptidoglycan-associated lipoprotein Pal [unclassified Caulobacter]PXA84444.1 peptidoglycan-associated lipoprotein Pal [Caulobacter sp. D5]PXA92100.1 peptidoglycan-associated lipoprotein Pal [Caulobacter sp. D4A]